MPLPTREEISPDDSLDGQSACEFFLGKSLEEVETLLRFNALSYQEHFMWVGPVAFRYYLAAVVNFVRSDGAKDDPDFIAHFATTLEWRLRYLPMELIPIADQLTDLCAHIVENWTRFEKVEDTYGDVRTRYEALRRAFSQMA